MNMGHTNSLQTFNLKINEYKVSFRFSFKNMKLKINENVINKLYSSLYHYIIMKLT